MSGITDEFAGNAKQVAGEVTGDDQLKTEGKVEEITGQVEQKVEGAIEAINDKVEEVKEHLEHNHDEHKDEAHTDAV